MTFLKSVNLRSYGSALPFHKGMNLANFSRAKVFDQPALINVNNGLSSVASLDLTNPLSLIFRITLCEAPKTSFSLPVLVLQGDYVPAHTRLF